MKIKIAQREIIAKEKTIKELITNKKAYPSTFLSEPSQQHSSNFGHMRIKLFKMISNFGYIHAYRNLQNQDL